MGSIQYARLEETSNIGPIEPVLTAMEFTLEQLSPENMKMLLESAFITVDSIIPVEFEENGTTQKYWGHVIVKDDGYYWRITPTDDEYIQFSYGWAMSPEQCPAPEMVLLKASNYFDTFPVHLHYKGKMDNGNHGFEFIYSQIFPQEAEVTPKRFVQIFRTFQKLTKRNVRNFFDVIKIVEEGTND